MNQIPRSMYGPSLGPQCVVHASKDRDEGNFVSARASTRTCLRNVRRPTCGYRFAVHQNLDNSDHSLSYTCIGGVRGIDAGVRGYAVESGGEPAWECSNESDSGGVCWRISQCSSTIADRKNSAGRADGEAWYSHMQQRPDTTASQIRQRPPLTRSSC